MRRLLIVYGLLQHPLRSTVSDHLYAFRRHARARCFYANVAIGPVPRWLLRMEYDAVVYHTSLLASIRWAPALDERLIERSRAVRAAAPVRVALPQDEFLRSDALCRFIRECDVNVVCSVAPPSEWPKIYRGIDTSAVHFEQVLTGYLSDRTLARIKRIVASIPNRPVDLSYRAGAPRPYLGRHGMLKTEVARLASSAAEARQLVTDISVRSEDALLGDDWFRHLARSRWTLGVEGGASILDQDGSVRERTEAYLQEHPDASFDEVNAACFPGRDGELELFALSPRHLEACATRTAQALVEGSYNGILRPNVHYLPLDPDLGNLGSVLDAMEDEGLRHRLSDQAYRDIVSSGRYSYARFVAQVEDSIASLGPRAKETQRATVTVALAAGRGLDRAAWWRVAYRLRWRAHILRAAHVLAGPIVRLRRLIRDRSASRD